MAIVISLIIFLGVLGTMAGLVVWQIRRTDPSRADTSIKDDISTAQEFLPFQDISDSMINLGNHQYRAVIEVPSINYHLKTKKEKEALELAYSRFLNSLDFPYSMFIQTVTMDNTNMLKSLKEDIERTLEEFPQLSEYAEILYHDMSNIHERTQTTKQKRKFLIIPYDDAVMLTNMNDEEKYMEAAKELYNRCSQVIDGLEAIGLRARVLSTNEISSLITSVYHRQNYSHVQGLIDGDYLQTFVQGEQKMSNILAEGKLDLILVEARNKLETQLYQDGTTPKPVLEATKKVIYEIEKIRDQLAGFYKSNVSLTVPKDDEHGGAA